MTTEVQMDRYKSHKEVYAFQIVRIEAGDSFSSLIGDRCSVTVDQAYLEKHQPQVSGYYVKYVDGYESWSPAEAFEDGYTKIE